MNRESPDWGTTGRSRKKEALPGAISGRASVWEDQRRLTPALPRRPGANWGRTVAVPTPYRKRMLDAAKHQVPLVFELAKNPG